MPKVDKNGFEYVEVDNNSNTYVETGEQYIVPICWGCKYVGYDRDTPCNGEIPCDAITTQKGIGRLYFQPRWETEHEN